MGVGVFWRALAAMCMAALPAAAHEFWIEPQTYHVELGETASAGLFVGMDFEGREQSYLPRNFKEFTRTDQHGTEPVEMTLGDRPAFVHIPTQEGALLLGYVSNPMRVIYREVEKFQDFITEKDFDWVWGAHQARGLGTERIVETYHRYAKAMINVGGGAAVDTDLGYEIEFVAQTPLGAAGAVVFLLEYQNAPLPDTQVTVWAKSPDGEVTMHHHRSDANGRVAFEVASGQGYLVDAVVIRAIDERSTQLDPMWETVWASYTFGAIP